MFHFNTLSCSRYSCRGIQAFIYKLRFVLANLVLQTIKYRSLRALYVLSCIKEDMSTKAQDCGCVHTIRTLSYVTATISAIISLSTITANGLLIIIFIRHRKTILRQLFYKVIFNIILSDFLNGLIADNLKLSYVVFGSVSVVTMGLLGAERQWALLQPFSYRVGLNPRTVYSILGSTWVFSILMSLIYLWLGFHRSLIIFASVTVTLSFIIMLITVIVYYYKLLRRPLRVGIQALRKNSTPRIEVEAATSINCSGSPPSTDQIANSSVTRSNSSQDLCKAARTGNARSIPITPITPPKADTA